ncbi:MAG: SagB/ThcOx family dehydrogenase [Candidatus Eisenbacteria bacterium]
MKKADGGRPRAVKIALPEPGGADLNSVEDAIRRRRSIRKFLPGPARLDHVGRLLWAGQGITEEGGARAAPSAGGTYPLILYLIAGEVDGLPAGLYKYRPTPHGLTRVSDRDLRGEVAAAALAQQWIAGAPFTIVIVADYDRTTNRYGERGVRYVRMEAGHAAENIHLLAVTLGLGSTPVAAFEDRELQNLLELPDNEEPLYLVPVGSPR